MTSGEGCQRAIPMSVGTQRLLLALAPALSIGLAQVVSGTQAPIFPTRVEVVRVSVLVRGPQGPILNLRATDFEVRDNSVRQEVDRVIREELPLNVVMAFDVSGSVRGKNLGELKRAAHELVDGLRPGDRAALLTFADTLRLRFPLSSDFVTLHTQIAGLDPEGGTSLADGTFAALALGDADPGRVLAIVFTDGQETVSWLREADVVETAKQTEVVLYAVLLGGQGSTFLGRVASTTGGRLLSVSSPDRLRQTFLDILSEFKARYVLSYTPRGVDRKGWHRIDVRVRGKSAKVLARKGYVASQ